MLQYKIIDTSKRIDLDKTDKSKEREICYYNYFNNSFKNNSKVCNDCNKGIIAFWGIGYRVSMSDMTEDDVLNISRELYIKFNPNKAPVAIIKEEVFGGTYFRDIYSVVNGKWYKNS